MRHNPPLTAASPPLPCSRVVARAASSEQVAGGRWAAEDFFPVNKGLGRLDAFPFTCLGLLVLARSAATVPKWGKGLQPTEHLPAILHGVMG